MIESQRTTNTVTSQVVSSSTYCYDYADRLLSSSDAQLGTPTYDDHGNTATLAGNGTPITFTYDASDSNTAIEQGANKVTYLKTASGSVLRKKEYQSGTLTKSYRYLAGGAVMQSCSLTDDNNCVTTDTYLNLPGGVTLTLSPTNPDTTKQVVYSIKNFHGDTAVTAGSTGLPTSSVFLYEPFGLASASITFGTNSDPTNATDQSMGWAANPTRKVAGSFSIPILQMGARVYLPTAGRFAQVDPIEGGTANSYVYAADPINQSDYSGQSAIALNWGAFAVSLSFIPGLGTVVASGAVAVSVVALYTKAVNDNARAREEAASKAQERSQGYVPKAGATPTPQAPNKSNYILKPDSDPQRNVALLQVQNSLLEGIKPGRRIMLNIEMGDSIWRSFTKQCIDYGDFEIHYMVNDVTREYGQLKAKNRSILDC